MLRWQALVTASSRVTSAQLTLSTPPQMPQLLTDTDSLRLVPIVATCSVLYIILYIYIYAYIYCYYYNIIIIIYGIYGMVHMVLFYYIIYIYI